MPSRYTHLESGMVYPAITYIVREGRFYSRVQVQSESGSNQKQDLLIFG